MDKLKLTINKYILQDLNSFVEFSLEQMKASEVELLDLFVMETLVNLLQRCKRQLKKTFNPKTLSLDTLESESIKHAYHWFSEGDETFKLPGLLEIIKQLEQKEI